jgi:hypothetical protein
MRVRFYTPADYQQLCNLYKHSDQFEFDEVTDSEENLIRKIKRDPESLLVVEENGKIVGSVSVIEDGRIALLFRLVALDNNQDTLQKLIIEAENILRKRGYEEVHNTAPLEDLSALMEREKLGFNKGKPYMWFWKKI